MPCIILAPIKISAVTSNGTVNFGDVIQIAPKSAQKTFSGSGGGNNGDFLQTNTFISMTNTIDPDVIDDSTLSKL